VYIVHESMQEEAAHVAELFQDVLRLKSTIIQRGLDRGFIYIPEFDGYTEYPLWYLSKVTEFLGIPEGKAALVLTQRDRYAASNSKEDDWVFGTNYGDIAIVNTARMKRPDNQPSQKLAVTNEVYEKRVAVLALHEIGHRIARASHFQPATWIAANGYELELGGHCTNDSCVMYEVVDIRAPPESEGHLRLGKEKRFDAGLDDLIERLNPNWFCDLCISAIQISDAYK